MQITEANVLQVWLKARELAEAAHIVAYSHHNIMGYEERMKRAQERLMDLIKALEGKE